MIGAGPLGGLGGIEDDVVEAGGGCVGGGGAPTAGDMDGPVEDVVAVVVDEEGATLLPLSVPSGF